MCPILVVFSMMHSRVLEIEYRKFISTNKLYDGNTCGVKVIFYIIQIISNTSYLVIKVYSIFPLVNIVRFSRRGKSP